MDQRHIIVLMFVDVVKAFECRHPLSYKSAHKGFLQNAATLTIFKLVCGKSTKPYIKISFLPLLKLRATLET